MTSKKYGKEELQYVAAATNIIVNHLGTSCTVDSIHALWEIKNGNKEELLSHVSALANIFTKAKEVLEKRK